MLPIYLASMALGGVLIGASLLFGGGDGDMDHDGDVDFDVDVDVDVDVDADVDHHIDAGDIIHVDDGDVDHPIDAGDIIHVDDAAQQKIKRWIPFFSMRFWTFGMASFGLTGSVLTALGVAAIGVAATASVLGLSIGYGAAWVFHSLSRNQITGATGLTHLGGTHATVLIPLGPEKIGKIRLLVDGQHVDLPARTRCEQTISRKDTVLVIDIVDGMANITTLPDDYTEPTKE